MASMPPRWSSEHREMVAARRIRVAELTGQGLSIRQIAAALDVPMSTVRSDRYSTGDTNQRVAAEDRRQQVAELTRQGMSAAQIADKLKTTTRTVVRDRKELGITQPSGRPLSQQEIETVERLLDDGASMSEVARTIGRHPAVLSHNKRFRGRSWTRQQIAEYAALRRLELACG